MPNYEQNVRLALLIKKACIVENIRYTFGNGTPITSDLVIIPCIAKHNLLRSCRQASPHCCL